MKELVVIAEKEELKLIKELGFDLYPVLITGVGAMNVINALKDVPKDTKIINIGYAGSKDLEPGKFYQVDNVALLHPNVSYFEPRYNLFETSPYSSSFNQFETKTCYTSCDFVTETDLKNCLFDMELAFIRALGFEDILAFKYVSDNLDLQEYRKTVNEK